MLRLRDFLKEHKALLVAIIIIALPAIGEMSLNSFLGLCDTLMISHLIGSEALAAVGFANQIIFTLIFIFSSFNTGATAMIARAFGEKDYPKLNKIAGEAVFINIIIGIIITILSWVFAKKIFGIFDMTDEVLNLSLTYFYVILFGMIFMFLSFSYAAILRGAGDTFTPMIITGIVNILNIIGNYLLITGAGPFPKLGIVGAAWSTSVSRMIATIIYTYILFIKSGPLRIKVRNMKVTKEVLKPLFKISLPGGGEQALIQISFLIIGVIISQLDTDSEAAFRILMNIESISFMPAVGLSIAATTLVGKALGERDIEKAVNTGYAAAGLGALWGIFMGLIFFILPKQLLGIFTSETNIILLSLTTMYFMGINQPSLNFMIVMSGALRGTGDTFSVMVITALRLWVTFIPLSYIFIIVLKQGVIGMWYGEIISFLIFNIIMFMRFKSKKWVNIKIDS